MKVYSSWSVYICKVPMIQIALALNNAWFFYAFRKLNVCVCISRAHAALHLLLMSVEYYASCPVDFGSHNIWEANFALNDTVIKTAVCLRVGQTDCFLQCHFWSVHEQCSQLKYKRCFAPDMNDSSCKSCYFTMWLVDDSCTLGYCDLGQ